MASKDFDAMDLVQLRLCPKDQKKPNSCSACDDLHCCSSYLFNEKCSAFYQFGRCSRSHTFWTRHNVSVLKKRKLDLRQNDLVEVVAKLVQSSAIPAKSSENSKSKHEKAMHASASSGVHHEFQDARNFTYVFNGSYRLFELAFLFGPIRIHLNQSNMHRTLPSGYCPRPDPALLATMRERIRNQMSQQKLRTERIRFTDPQMQFFVCNPYVAKYLEQDQQTFAFYCQSYRYSFRVDVQNLRSGQSDDAPLTHTSSKSQEPVCIPKTHSSIDVMLADITEMNVDLIVVLESSTLLQSILHKAGPMIESQYRKGAFKSSSLLLENGSLHAKILIYKTNLFEHVLDTTKTEKKLAHLVNDCIEKAQQYRMKSIAFPAIGTGHGRLQPQFVSSVMINAARRSLDRWMIDVVFVIHPAVLSSGPNLYNIFRHSLECIRQDTQSSTDDFRRTIKCNKLYLVSNASNNEMSHLQVNRSIDDLIATEIYSLSGISTSVRDSLQMVIDFCLKYHTIPTLNFRAEKLILHGEKESCRQCWANILSHRRRVHEYWIMNENGNRKLNASTALRLDEASAVNEHQLRISERPDEILDFDLLQLHVRINNDRPPLQLSKSIIQDGIDSRSSTWSQSSFMVRTSRIEAHSNIGRDCIRRFEQSMPPSEWTIDRVKMVENIPLYLYFKKYEGTEENFAFHACPWSVVQSIIHYGLHSSHYGRNSRMIGLAKDALTSHVFGGHRSMGGQYHMFVVYHSNKAFHKDIAGYVSDDQAHLFLPRYLISYRRRNEFM